MLCRKTPRGHRVEPAISLEERCLFLTGSPRLHLPTVRMFFCNLIAWGGCHFVIHRKEGTQVLAVALGIEKRKKRKKKKTHKKLQELHFHFLPSFHQDYSRQVENTMLKINSSVLLWSLLPYPVWTWPSPQGNRNVNLWSWGYADTHVEGTGLAIFFFLSCY